MFSSLKLTSSTLIGRQQQKKLSLILSYLIDCPQGAQFLNPVDWQDLQLNDYPLVVKNPMNLLKVQDKFKLRDYRIVEEMLDHIQLVWDNCKSYNLDGPFYTLADKMERNFKKMIKNYLPNIQIIVPKPFNSTSTSNNLVNPQPTIIPPVVQTKPNHTSRSQIKTSTRNISPHINSQPLAQSSYEDPPSLNQPNQNIYQQQMEEIPQSQKNRFHQRLKQLTQQDLAQIVLIIQEQCPDGFKDQGNGRSQLHLDNIDAETFKKLNQRIDDMMDGEKMQGAANKKVKI